MNKKVKQLLFLAVIILAFFLIPVPQGLYPLAWYLFGIYLACILGLILKPYKEPVILIAGIAFSAITISLYNNFCIEDGAKALVEAKNVLSGYASPTTWLVFAAFSLSVSFVVTGLGKRIAYLLIGAFGSTTLRLGYVNVLLELLLAPGMPSNTARAGGVITPIFNSVAQALGSDPEVNPKKAGRYLLLNVYMITKQTSTLFLTGMAPNALALKMLHDINPSFNLTWVQWFVVASVPILTCLFLTPFVAYMLCTPELKRVDNKTISKKGLEELGPIKKKEKYLLVVFILALLGWILGSLIGIDSASVAIFAMAVLLISTVISWENILKSSGGWNTLIWYGGIIGLSGVLKAVAFFPWLGETMKDFLGNINISSPLLVVSLILFISVVIRYVFASGGAYVAAMIPVFGLLGMTLLGPEAVSNGYFSILAIGLLLTNSIGGLTTHYGSAAAPVVFACGYNDIKSWWIVGNVLAYGSLLVICLLGTMWWKFLLSIHFI